jgi:hypothetical protein
LQEKCPADDITSPHSVEPFAKLKNCCRTSHENQWLRR